MHKFTFREKITLLAVAFVVVIQVVSFVPVLNAIKTDSEVDAHYSVQLAGAALEEYTAKRTEKLRAMAYSVAGDSAFGPTVAAGQPAEIRAAFENLAQAEAADLAILARPDGSALDLRDRSESAIEPSDVADSLLRLEFGRAAITYVDGRPHHVVAVRVQHEPSATRLILGYELGREAALAMRTLTGLDVSFLTIDGSRARALASTIGAGRQASAIASLDISEQIYATSGLHVDQSEEWLTLLRPLIAETPELFVALQLSLRDAMVSYRDTRVILIASLAASLLLALTSAYWVAGMVTKPVDRLASAAKRICAGVYNENVVASSSDELGHLAAGFNAMQDAIAERERHIYHVANHDSLSGLPNREMSVSKLRGLLVKHEHVQVISIAIDRFSRFISSLGHRASDDVIQHVAGLLRSIVDERGFLGHLNGHEFVIVIPDSDEQDALNLIDQIGRGLHSGVRVDGANFSLKVTAGIASFPEHQDDAAGLLHRAALARTEAKVLRQSVAAYRVGQEERAVKRIRLIGDFPSATENNELVAYYQPKIDCRTLTVIGAEALVRWNHPELGLLSPYDFVEAVEQAGSVSQLTRWMMRAAVRQAKSWREQGLNIGVAVNISVDDLVDEYLPHYLLELAQEYDVKPCDVTLEVTESAIMHNVFTAMSVIACIHELGFRLAIDDFGTGQSSLARLSRLPVDELKLDRSFIVNIDQPKYEAIVHATIEMANGLGLTVCAEGIEDMAAIDVLYAMGAKDAQGFAMSKPLPGDEFLEWERHWARQSATKAATRRPEATLFRLPASK